MTIKPKNAIIRFRVLDKCFRNTGRRFYIDDLIDACSSVLSERSSRPQQISRRTILNDIAFMESDAGWGGKNIDILRIKDADGRRCYYRYADTSFSIENTPLTTKEIDQLRSAIGTLTQFKGLPQFEWMDEILQKLTYTTDARSIPYVGFDNNPYLKGVEHIDILYRAIRDNLVLTIRYQSFNWDESKEFIFHPYYLKQYNNRWFIFGYNAEYQIADWNMALDRIIHIKALPQELYLENTIDWSEYFSNIVGVSNSKDTSIELVVLHCFNSCGKYVENKPIHESQRHRWLSKDCLEIKLLVKLNFELENYILGHGEKIKVISPKILQEKIKNRVLATYHLYKKNLIEYPN